MDISRLGLRDLNYEICKPNSVPQISTDAPSLFQLFLSFLPHSLLNVLTFTTSPVNPNMVGCQPMYSGSWLLHKITHWQWVILWSLVTTLSKDNIIKAVLSICLLHPSCFLLFLRLTHIPKAASMPLIPHSDFKALSPFESCSRPLNPAATAASHQSLCP